MLVCSILCRCAFHLFLYSHNTHITYIRWLHTHIIYTLHTYIHTYTHTYVRTYVRTYIHTHIRTYIHIHTYVRSFIYLFGEYVAHSYYFKKFLYFKFNLQLTFVQQGDTVPASGTFRASALDDRNTVLD
jgi:nitrate/nitrite transporter NarK